MPPKRICFSGARTDLVIFDANSLKLLLRPPVSLFPATRVIERGEEMSKYNSALLRPKCSRPIRNTQDRVKRIKRNGSFDVCSSVCHCLTCLLPPKGHFCATQLTLHIYWLGWRYQRPGWSKNTSAHMKSQYEPRLETTVKIGNILNVEGESVVKNSLHDFFIDMKSFVTSGGTFWASIAGGV